ncbi:hypothetical protein K431DRAFT_311231 [Polychaeton citri CBS 116435]|uniref:Uncharacterized protein n=1 Tax=Polychaeton citri CBS 116435 TaxID=1314669 RepID=A0A9P4QDV4_9PEZI|nr:hypothetical protein K431DRAFT_311231 [Polychaeton citri CBS 116435]
MSSNPWSDRRGLFQKGKEIHEPTERRSSQGSVSDALRRASVGSVGSGTTLEKTPTTSSSTGGSSDRRRSSAASGGGLFGNLTSMKRGSEDYETRRASHAEMTGNQGGVLSGWYNKTFKGMQNQNNPGNPAQKPSDASRRGVMRKMCSDRGHGQQLAMLVL